MRRRRFIVGLSGLGLGSSLILGSGAFTSVTAKRSLTVTVAPDSDAYLGLEPITDSGIGGKPTGRSGVTGNGVVFFSIPGTGTGENQNAKGVGTDSIYVFESLLRITNLGTQAVEVYSEYDGDTFAALALINDGKVLAGDSSWTLDVGKDFTAGLYIDTTKTPLGEYDETLTIVAEA